MDEIFSKPLFLFQLISRQWPDVAQPSREDEGTDELLQGAMELKLLPGASVRLSRLLRDLSFQIQSRVAVHYLTLALLN